MVDAVGRNTSGRWEDHLWTGREGGREKEGGRRKEREREKEKETEREGREKEGETERGRGEGREKEGERGREGRRKERERGGEGRRREGGRGEFGHFCGRMCKLVAHWHGLLDVPAKISLPNKWQVVHTSCHPRHTGMACSTSQLGAYPMAGRTHPEPLKVC